MILQGPRHGEWKPWFAWRPVTWMSSDDRMVITRVWLSWVERRWDYYLREWEYRLGGCDDG